MASLNYAHGIAQALCIVLALVGLVPFATTLAVRSTWVRTWAATETEHALALRVRPARVNAAIDQPPRHDAEALRIEIAKIDDIDGHEPNLTRRHSVRGAQYGIAGEALTPYFKPI